MIRLQPISTSDLQHYKFMEELLIDSFPPEEYRQLEQLREYTDRTGNFHNNIIFYDCFPVRLIIHWDYRRLRYVEHSTTKRLKRHVGAAERGSRQKCSQSNRTFQFAHVRRKAEVVQ